MSADRSTSWSYAEQLPEESDVLLRARERSHELGVSAVTPGVAAALTVLAATSGAQTVVEVGTGAGVSGVALLAGLPSTAVLTTIDSDVDHLKAARESFADAGVASNRTRTISGRASAVLPRLTDGAYDMVFLDADTASLPHYVDHAVRLLSSGGLVIVNNALGSGRVANPAARDETTTVLRSVGRTLREDDRLQTAMLTTGNGLLLGVRR